MRQYQIFSCPCLYGECAISAYENETYEQLEFRIAQATSGKYWISNFNLNPTIMPYINEKRWVACIAHCSRILNNIVITSTQQQMLVETCARRHLSDYKEVYMNCFRFFFEDKMPVIGFCNPCIRHLMSRTPRTFLLHRVKIYNGKENEP